MKTTIFNSSIFNSRLFVEKHIQGILAILFLGCWFYFYSNCIDVQDWFIENILVFVGVGYLVLFRKRLQLSVISYVCLFLFMLLHIYGAQYAYTQNPLGEWLQNTYALTRNPYDRIVHFSFGLLLVVPLKELIAIKYKLGDGLLALISINIITSVACLFELIEWTVAELTTKETGETYVATQGDVWDAHKDIAVAILGAFITLLVSKFYKK